MTRINFDGLEYEVEVINQIPENSKLEEDSRVYMDCIVERIIRTTETESECIGIYVTEKNDYEKTLEIEFNEKLNLETGKIYKLTWLHVKIK